MKRNSKFSKVAIAAAKEAGDFLMKDFGKVKVLQYKDRQDILTNIDLKSEKAIIKKIKQNFPDHNIISEEKGYEDLKSEYTWVIDPIDGTKHYLRKMPIFCVSIALMKDKEVILGVVYAPSFNALFFAEKGKGAYLNNKKINVSQTKNLKDAFIFAELPNVRMLGANFKKDHEKLGKLFEQSYRVRAWGAGALGICYTALGSFDGYLVLHKGVKFWDVAGASIILTEAGGKITDEQGNKFTSKTVRPVASNNKIHNQMLKILKNDK